MRLYLLAAVAKFLAIVSMTLYTPLHLLNCLSDYLFELSGCADFQEQDEQDILDECENNETNTEDYG